jgi:membrane dipeptidase
MPRPPRLIDLHIPWLLQYAPETTFFDPSLYPEVPGRLAQLDGYFSATTAAVVALGMAPGDWARRPDPWAAVGDLLARAEAEFSGRLLIGPDDVARWRAEPPDAMSWAVLAIDGLNRVARGPEDLDRLDTLFHRGVRVFRMTDDPDEDMFTIPKTSLIYRIASLASNPGPSGPRPVLDMAGLGPDALAAALDWYESGPGRENVLLPLFSHGAPGSLPGEVLARLRALGTVLGFSPGSPWHDSAESLQAAILETSAIPGPPGSSPFDGLAFGTAFLRADTSSTGIGNATALGRWATKAFGPEIASALLHKNAERLILQSVGAVRESVTGNDSA